MKLHIASKYVLVMGMLENSMGTMEFEFDAQWNYKRCFSCQEIENIPYPFSGYPVQLVLGQMVL